MPTGISIFDRTIKSNITDIIPGPDRPGVTVVRFNEGCEECIKQNKTEHDETLTLTMTEHHHSNNANKDKCRIYGHGDEHKEPVQYCIRVTLHKDNHLHSHSVQGMAADTIYEYC